MPPALGALARARLAECQREVTAREAVLAEATTERRQAADDVAAITGATATAQIAERHARFAAAETRHRLATREANDARHAAALAQDALDRVCPPRSGPSFIGDTTSAFPLGTTYGHEYEAAVERSRLHAAADRGTPTDEPWADALSERQMDELAFCLDALGQGAIGHLQLSKGVHLAQLYEVAGFPGRIPIGKEFPGKVSIDGSVLGEIVRGLPRVMKMAQSYAIGSPGRTFDPAAARQRRKEWRPPVQTPIDQYGLSQTSRGGVPQ